jgi:toxin ParE1/3/4
MTGFRLYRTADERLDEVWSYTYEKWGEQQAEKYIKGLFDYFQKLSDNKLLWCSLPGRLVVPEQLDIALYFGRYKQHWIFFKELSSGDIGIAAILHDAMDIPVRLQDDLSKLSIVKDE